MRHSPSPGRGSGGLARHLLNHSESEKKALKALTISGLGYQQFRGYVEGN